MELEPLFDIGILPPPLPPSPAQSPALFDLTPYLLMPQRTVAKMLGLPMSTLSKRWRIAGKEGFGHIDGFNDWEQMSESANGC